MGLRVSCILEVCGAFGRRVLGEDFAAGVGDRFAALPPDPSKEGLEPGEDLLDRIEVREYFGRNTRRAGSDIPDRFVHRQVATTTAYPDPLFPLALIDAESVPTRGAQHLSFTA